ncbi:hypothetical protein PP707_03850 [Acetobacter pasteurianus]|uniref:uncharacterized protein n=1 Tax=Lodderomyces elongisporus TaxID=36914 RepID=UPI002920E1C0|nr:uncharacterized protein PVL30_002496 [Lodderomyces elongisporus]MDC6271410.1 hypothetical protein [Acetobacter pasteurianus]WLF78753.1 hypothetical protein PVL30_002496 [Lodderomyces elongisporus]
MSSLKKTESYNESIRSTTSTLNTIKTKSQSLLEKLKSTKTGTKTGTKKNVGENGMNSGTQSEARATYFALR